LGQVNWLVTHLAELRALIEMLNWNPPLGRTGHIYRRWRPVVLARDRSLARGRLAAELRKTRRELATFQPRVQLPSRVSSRARYLAVLKRWSGAAEGPFTATAYTAWRRAVDPTLPSRNTVARAFGSWVLALGAAGLSTEGCRPTAQVAATRRAAAARRAKEDPALRAKVLLSVARCEAELGGRPRALAYLRWRLDVDPDSPSQATIYRLFPGGWASVLAALDAR
jgi:hypothetical protein